MATEIIGYFYTSDGGDGEVHPQFFLKKEDAQAAYDDEVEQYGHAAGEVVTLRLSDFKTEFVKDE
jgi:hypothetical protein